MFSDYGVFWQLSYFFDLPSTLYGAFPIVSGLYFVVRSIVGRRFVQRDVVGLVLYFVHGGCGHHLILPSRGGISMFLRAFHFSCSIFRVGE